MTRDERKAIMLSSTATATSITGRSPKPRAFVMPVVRPAPPRPSTTGAVATW
jgi:hypothetical protein